MRPDCSQIAQATTVRIELVKHDGHAFVEGEFANNYNADLWIAQEPSPAYRVNPQTGAVVISYGYFEDVYGSFRGHYMIPPMKKISPRNKLRWRLEGGALVQRLLTPGIQVQLRMRVAVAEFPTSNVRGHQPLDAYLEASCTVQSPPLVLRS